MTDFIYKIRYGSLEYLPVKIKATRLGEDYDPTADLVQMALPVIDIDPVTDDWKNAIWQTVNDDFIANILVGPGGDIELGRGDYDILIKITDDPEVPVLRAGMLKIL